MAKRNLFLRTSKRDVEEAAEAADEDEEVGKRSAAPWYRIPEGLELVNI